MPTALIIDERAESLLEMSDIARDCGFAVEAARSMKSSRRLMQKRMPEVAILNVHDGDSQVAGEALEFFAQNDLAGLVDVLLVSRITSYELAVHGMRAGSSDFFQWPDESERLREVLCSLRDEIREPGEGAVHRSARGLLVGESPAMQRLYRMIRKVAPTEATVFVIGESGSGKELIARTIHELSSRRAGPFIAMNCGAISGELIESEMFGHRKGAFTGAHADHKGFFERARQGTLLLDEITEMKADLQVRLLRVLETRQVRPVGGEKDVEVDVRIIASTNRDPQEAISEGVLREDLYYRIAEFPMSVPPLRERGDDIVLLAEQFLSEASTREGPKKSFSSEALDLLRLHDWPGNVRELKNAVYRAFILALDEVTPEDLPGNLPAGGAMNGDYLRFPVGFKLKELERRMILATLEHFDDDKPKTAESLGISLKTLYNRLKRYQSD